MARFEGTPAEFRRFLDPWVRNTIQYHTRRRKRELGRCQNTHCREAGELDAAHLFRRDRMTVVLEALGLSPTSRRIVIKDLRAAEIAIVQAHQPLEKVFLFLCKPCHRHYGRTGRLP